MKSKINKITLLSLFSAIALVLSFLENSLVPDIPFLPVGAKPGLSNIVTMYTASLFGFGGAVYITLIKVLFAFLTRGATAAFMSFCGGFLSTVVLCLMIRYEGKTFSFIGIGIVCALCHNMGQLFCAALISGTASLISYGKYLIIFALITGFVTGSALTVIIPRLKKLKEADKIKSDK